MGVTQKLLFYTSTAVGMLGVMWLCDVQCGANKCEVVNHGSRSPGCAHGFGAQGFPRRGQLKAIGRGRNGQGPTGGAPQVYKC